ncbi:spike base protein, RCAP_Rcc01079 family [Sphingomonas sp. 2378]|uniref:spike base protein, RCAP_Rcc01079 family n=1 Tax=Sphingomonas sp. 2378 TaxID=1219748 RepID=UPI00311ACFBA
MADPFRGFADTVSDPATRAVAIVPADAADLADIPKGIYVGTGGDITMIGAGAPSGATGVTWKNVPAGALIPFRPRRILATGTTAANMLGLY